MFRAISLRDLEFDEIPVAAQTPSGVAYTRWVRAGMPRIPQHTADCVVFLYRSKDDALNRRDPQGTGFVVAVPSRASKKLRHSHFYVISNWHVAVSPKGEDEPASVVCLNLKDGSPDPIELDPCTDW